MPRKLKDAEFESAASMFNQMWRNISVVLGMEPEKEKKELPGLLNSQSSQSTVLQFSGTPHLRNKGEE